MSRATAKEWGRRVRAWKRSRQTAEEFASEHEFSASTLRWWSWRLKRDSAAAPKRREDSVTLVPVEIVEDEARETERWSLSFPSGHVLRVGGDVRPDELGALLKLLALDDGPAR